MSASFSLILAFYLGRRQLCEIAILAFPGRPLETELKFEAYTNLAPFFRFPNHFRYAPA